MDRLKGLGNAIVPQIAEIIGKRIVSCERLDLGDGKFAIICGGHRRRPSTVNFPATRGELTAAGYKLKASRNCRLCGGHLEFWLTPKNKLAPLEVVAGNKLQSHFATCPHAAKFRKPEQEELFK